MLNLNALSVYNYKVWQKYIKATDIQTFVGFCNCNSSASTACCTWKVKCHKIFYTRQWYIISSLPVVAYQKIWIKCGRDTNTGKRTTDNDIEIINNRTYI